MQDRELYRRILGIESPWWVERVDLKLGVGEIHVYLGHDEGPWHCRECGQACTIYDHQEERQWRHLDTCQYRTILHAQVPRTDCREHGAKTVKVSWAEAGSRFTMLMEALAIEWLKHASQKAVGEQLGLSWDAIHGIMDRAVKRGLGRRKAEVVRRLGVDEKSHKGHYSYFTIVNDLDRGRVLYVGRGREKATLDAFWPTLTESQLHGIEAVAVDMWDGYVNSIQQHVPEAAGKIVHDKFHIAQYLGQAIDRVRRRESKTLRSSGDNRLSGTRFLWLSNLDNLRAEDKPRFAKLRRSHLKTARAWALRQAGMEFFNYVYEEPARKHFRWWYQWAIRSRLEPMVKVAKMLKRRFANIITYLKHRITNAASESINARIQWVKYTARGFRNMDNFITAIYFHCGGLDLAASPTP
jgi:transposase